jgi:hypothetical protein
MIKVYVKLRSYEWIHFHECHWRQSGVKLDGRVFKEWTRQRTQFVEGGSIHMIVPSKPYK